MLNNIAHYRKIKCLTQAELAKKLGVTQQNVSAWESGISLPLTSTALKLAQILDVPLDELIKVK